MRWGNRAGFAAEECACYDQLPRLLPVLRALGPVCSICSICSQCDQGFQYVQKTKRFHLSIMILITARYGGARVQLQERGAMGQRGGGFLCNVWYTQHTTPRVHPHPPPRAARARTAFSVTSLSHRVAPAPPARTKGSGRAGARPMQGCASGADQCARARRRARSSWRRTWRAPRAAARAAAAS